MYCFKTKARVVCLIAVGVAVFASHSNAQDPFTQLSAIDGPLPCYDCGTADFVFADSHATESLGGDYFQSPDDDTDSPWFIRAGVGVLLFADSATLRAGGNVVPGAGLEISDATTFVFDIGYELSPVWTATFSAGVPPRLDLDGTGIFQGVSYGTTKFAPVALSLQRHFFVTPRSSIYLGGGANYTAQYESIDGFIQDFDIKNDAAVVLQLGIERRCNKRISLFADAKKAFYRTEAFGNIGGIPIRSDVIANTTLLSFGVKYDF